MTAILIRCDGSSEIGMGHLSRCLALADELKSAHECSVRFAMRDPSSAGATEVRLAGYPVESVPDDPLADYGDWLRTTLRSLDARALVVDVRDALSRGSLDDCRRDGALVVAIDEATDRRLAADVVFYPPVPQVADMDWSQFSGRRYGGWEWVILGREFAEGAGGAGDAGDAGDEVAGSPATDVLVTMGGSDPASMAVFTVRALGRLEMPLAIRVVMGPAFTHAEELLDAVARSHHSIQVSRAPSRMAPLMRASRIAFCSFGISAYELAACGVPAVHLCLTDDHARSSSAFDKEAIARTAGVMGRIAPEQVRDAASALLGDANLRMRMAARARQLVDGRGAARAAQVIKERLTRS